MTHECSFELDQDGQITCSICGAMDDDMKAITHLPPDFWSTQTSFEE